MAIWIVGEMVCTLFVHSYKTEQDQLFSDHLQLVR